MTRFSLVLQSFDIETPSKVQSGKTSQDEPPSSPNDKKKQLYLFLLAVNSGMSADRFPGTASSRDAEFKGKCSSFFFFHSQTCLQEIDPKQIHK